MDHQSSQLVAGIRPTTDIALIERFTRVSPDCEEPATTTNFVAESSQVVDGSMSIGFKINVIPCSVEGWGCMIPFSILTAGVFVIGVACIYARPI